MAATETRLRSTSLLPSTPDTVIRPEPPKTDRVIRIPLTPAGSVSDSLYRRAIFTTIVLYSCWQIFATVVFDPLLDWADSEWESLSEKEKEEVQNMAEEDEPILFLPFPFTTQEVKQPPYKGSDPEWEMFVKVNKDTKLQKEIKCEFPRVFTEVLGSNISQLAWLKR